MSAKITIKPGHEFGRLTVISESQCRYSKTGKMLRRFSCECRCGVVGDYDFGNLRLTSKHGVLV